MNIGALLIGLAIFVLALPWLAGPFQTRKLQTAGQEDEGGVSLDQRRVEVLAALRALDFDYQTGKVAEADYTPLRAQLLAEAGQVLQLKRQKDQAVEDLIRARQKRVTQRVNCPDCQHMIQISDRFCPHCGNRVAHTCASCGERLQPTHNFCPGCGARQALQAAPEHSATTS